MPTEPADPERVLRDLLAGLGLKYAVHQTNAGRPYAGFGLGANAETLVSFAILFQTPGALAVRASGLPWLAAGEDTARLENEIGLRLPWLRLFRGAAPATLDVQIAIYLGEGLPDPDEVQLSIDRLRIFAGWARDEVVPQLGRATPGWTRTVAMKDLANGLRMSELHASHADSYTPVSDVGVAAAMARDLEAAGEAAQLLYGDAVAATRVVESDDHVLYLQIFADVDLGTPGSHDCRMLTARAFHDDRKVVEPTLATFERLAAISRTLIAGSALVDTEHGGARAIWLCALPLAKVDLGPPLATWLTDRARSAMWAIEQRLHRPPPG